MRSRSGDNAPALGYSRPFHKLPICQELWRTMTMTNQNDAAVGVPAKGIPRAFSIADLVPRANSPTSRSARVVNAETTGSQSLFAGVFWSDPGSKGGWSFGDRDPRVEGCPHVGSCEEVYLCLRGRVAVEWEGGSFEFGAGDIVY